MFYYLFTNDLRISMLSNKIQNAALKIINDTVPHSDENKSENNNIKTLSFYFNLTKDSVCSKKAAKGDIKAVVYNFIKKFQFPNMRTKESFKKYIENGIILAPLRVILQILYIMNQLYDKNNAYLTQEEIKYFIFFNENVAKTENIDFITLIKDIIEFRQTNNLPKYIYTNITTDNWKEEDRQLGEMIKILNWSGCTTFNNNKIVIDDNELSQENKAAIYDIINYKGFWKGDSEESYKKYMDIEENDEIIESDSELEDNNSHITRVEGGENILFYGVPGCGKSYSIKSICSDEKYMERVVFHPDYSYSDFVGQILPRINDFDRLEYLFTAGPFTRILANAYNDPSNMYYLIIEEINRGNAPAIFGEIFQLLDRTSDGTSEYGISNYDISKAVYMNSYQHVKIPSNLTVLATMNTSDQNVFTLDTAFQRRWKMKHISNKFKDDGHANKIIQGTFITWGNFISVINDIISDDKNDIMGSSDKRLGAYFAKEPELKSDIFPEKVLKYLWDDVFRMNKEIVFNNEYKTLEDIIDIYIKSTTDKLDAVLNKSVYQRMLNLNNNN